ncbi:MAG: ASCH domain-containing protein [Candidatus Berkelbacteria bacterium]|nr:ASCH domain-containing protein [Candidatus Berkelbacteria bacterium]MCR4307550.1 ASCH domain-containing protein [Candidatus Berkelbacteria bacterium]
MKSLKFREELVSCVLSGKKYSTWRLFDDKNIQKDDEIEFVNANTREVFTRAVVTKVLERQMGKLKKEEIKGHEKYGSNEEMYASFSDYYDQSIGPETIVKIIWFRLKE